jgi:hypothetical protein
MGRHPEIGYRVSKKEAGKSSNLYQEATLMWTRITSKDLLLNAQKWTVKLPRFGRTAQGAQNPHGLACCGDRWTNLSRLDMKNF